jgi:hypothetical protein
MTKKSIYTSSELPDHTLEEFQEITFLFLDFMEKLSEKYSMTSINAGMSKAMLEMLLMADEKSIKKALLDQAEYFLQAAEKVNE